MKKIAAYLLWIVFTGCGDGEKKICADDGDARGPVCLTSIETGQRFELLSKATGAFPAPERATKYMTPVQEGQGLLPTLWQNINRYEVHLFFLQAVFPEYFPDLDAQKYLEIILTRATRKYYSGNFYRFADPEKGQFYGFTVYTASKTEELLEANEVKHVYDTIKAVFSAGPLYYTFDPSDTMAKEKARSWQDPGFPIYFPER